MCYINVFYLVKWNNGVKEIWSCDLYGFENLKPLYDEEGNFFVGLWTKFRWLLVQASVKFGKCICYSIYACFTFCLFMSWFLVTESSKLINYSVDMCWSHEGIVIFQFQCWQYCIYIHIGNIPLQLSTKK
jgi:hypothetical protein